MEEPKSNPYYDLDHLLRGNVPENFFKRCIMNKCSEIKMSQDGIKEIIDLYEARRLKMSEDNLISIILRLISNIAIREKLSIITYDKYLEMKRRSARENLIGQKTEEQSEPRESTEEDLDPREKWLKEQFELIGAKMPQPRGSNSAEQGKVKHNPPATAESHVTTNNSVVQRPNPVKDEPVRITQGKKTIRTVKEPEINQRDIPVIVSKTIKLENFNTPESRDKLIVDLIMGGRTLNQVTFNGIPLNAIEGSKEIPEVKAYVNLLKKRIEEIVSFIEIDYINYNTTRKKDIKRVLEWLLGKRMGELESRKKLLSMTLDRYKKMGLTRRLDGIRTSRFKDTDTGEYEDYSMIFTIENLRNEAYINVGRGEESFKYEQMQKGIGSSIEKIIKLVPAHKKQKSK